jgi:large subunit ribosomal protein L18
MAIGSKSSRMTPRKRSKLRIRMKISGTDVRPRISVFRSSKHTYAQLIVDDSGKTIAWASTLEAEVVKLLGQGESVSTKSVEAARVVGKLLGQRCKEKNISTVVFDRNGFEYSGRIRAIADGARESGLIF